LSPYIYYLYAISFSYDIQKQGSLICKHLSRSEIQNEIGALINAILALLNDDDSETLLIGNGYCHFDVMFDK